MTSTLPIHTETDTLPPSSSLDYRAPDPLRVADLMRPLEPTIASTHTLREAADRIAQSAESFTVVFLHEEVVGILSAEDILRAAHADPTGWQTRPCTFAIGSAQVRLSPQHPLPKVLDEYRARGIRPFLVCEGDTPLGLLRPAEVRAWCQENHHAPWDDLVCRKVLREAASGEVGPR